MQPKVVALPALWAGRPWFWLFHLDRTFTPSPVLCDTLHISLSHFIWHTFLCSNKGYIFMFKNNLTLNVQFYRNEFFIVIWMFMTCISCYFLVYWYKGFNFMCQGIWILVCVSWIFFAWLSFSPSWVYFLQCDNLHYCIIGYCQTYSEESYSRPNKLRYSCCSCCILGIESLILVSLDRYLKIILSPCP